ncbi:MAG: glyoxalase superfamily protein [Roseibium album]|uniref:glyoxalase superfamily protein n=1 Tax=Roseibium album TaxID=311410 RepID=UPI00249044D1|nr:glyoxalase superfamily protein [Roseibium album]MCR9062097.1 glyoxalase superfamily protein [Paracoccaceae bacterium]
MTLPSVSELKSQAKRLRKALAANGKQLSHSQALELVSTQHGFRDWNTASATVSRPNHFAFSVGDRVSGTYMQQAFQGEIKALSKVGTTERYHVTIQFDEPVDVVTFDSFSAFRSRVNCLIRSDGVAVKKTSDGEPYLRLKPAEPDAD